MPFAPVILCVDDDEDDLNFIKEVIQSQNHSFQIQSARDGSEALQFLEKALTDNLLPCLVIMDMNMPRMNGKQTLDKIREHEQLARIPLAVFTTSSHAADREYFEKRGVHFMTKPFDYKVFVKEIVGLLALCADLTA
jgi:CheY-like chemotaxis protein